VLEGQPEIRWIGERRIGERKEDKRGGVVIHN
jgi:hypothetical protein